MSVSADAPRPLPDAVARERIRSELGTTLFAEAAAGTGKTTALVSRIVALLRTGTTTLDRIVALTFTEKAAGEMKLRVRSEIETARGASAVDAVERMRFEKALEHLEIARIDTIHAFCADLLHERPVEAGVGPLFEVAAEDEAEAMLDEAFDLWFEQQLSGPGEGVRRVLRRQSKGSERRGPRTELRQALTALVQHRDHRAAWRRDPFDRDSEIDAVIDRLRAIGGLFAQAKKPDDWLAKNLFNVQRFIDETNLLEQVRGRDHDSLEAELREFARRSTGWHYRGAAWAGFEGDLTREEVLERRDAAKDALDLLLRRADADLAAHLHEELLPVVDGYEEIKLREGKLDFFDLLMKARDLIRDDLSVRRTLQERYSHFLVDEFQDTDPLQAEILLLLAADDSAEDDPHRARPVPGKLFLVGDPKQSIYRFRRADVALYEEIKRRLVAGGAEVLQLTTSFRSRPGIQAAVNGAFAPVMAGGATQAEYVPLDAFRPPADGQPEVIVLPVPKPYSDYGKITQYAIEQSLPDAVAAFVEWLVTASGWRVTERQDPATLVPIQPRHVCLLFRRFKKFHDDVTRPYVHGLEVRRIPHVLMGGSSFHDREEVLALRNALTAIEWPGDALRVYATLRGPLFALGDDVLLAYRHRVGTFHPLRPSRDCELSAFEQPVADALAILRRLHYGRNRRPIARTLTQLLEAVRAHAGIAIWPTGEQALANCLRVVERARTFERGGAASFRAFVEKLEDEAERGVGEEAPSVEEGTEGVRIMTVHKAKGLEFPVVILADPTCKATRDQPSQYVDGARGLWAEPLCGAHPGELLDATEEELAREKAEADRVAYVAATRARDILVVPAVADEEQSGWYDPLHLALYAPPSKRRQGAEASGCPPFGAEAVTERPSSATPGGDRAMSPGRHTSQVGNAVVWWDPTLLDLAREQASGLQQHELLQADESGESAEASAMTHAAWQQRGAEVRAVAARPTLSVATVTGLTHLGGRDAETGPPPVAAPVGIEVVVVAAERAKRPGGTRFGNLVHAALASVDLAADAAEVAAVVASRARLLAAPPAEVEAAIAVVERALAHPVLRRAAACTENDLRREAPVLLAPAADQRVEGVLDLAFRETTGTGPVWQIVDFKTDQDIETQRAANEEQVRWYVQAVRVATGEAARGMLLFV